MDVSSTRAFHRSSGPTQVNRGQLRSNEVNDLCRLFRVILPSKVIWVADFDSDIHFALKRLEMRSWNHQLIKGQWRHMTRKLCFEFSTLKIIHRHLKTTVTFSTHHKEHAGRINFALAPSEVKLSAFTGFRHLSALDLTSEVTGWSWTLSLYINLFVSRRATYSSFPRSSSSIRGETARGVVSPPPCAVEGCEMACAGEG